jgi:hypothetical protein
MGSGGREAGPEIDRIEALDESGDKEQNEPDIL